LKKIKKRGKDESPGFVNIAKRPRIQNFEPKSRLILEIDESQQMFYDFLESIEMKKGEPYSFKQERVVSNQ
jgi:hypothetical protein